MSRVSIFKKLAGNRYLEGFWGDKSRDTNFFDPSIFDPYRPPGQNRWSKAYFCCFYDNMFYRF